MASDDAKMLVTRPSYDDTTFYCKKWSEFVIKSAERRIKVVKLDDKKVTKGNVTSMLQSLNPKFVFFNGRGDAKTITGTTPSLWSPKMTTRTSSSPK